MKKLLALTVTWLPLCILATACGILSPDEDRDRVVVTGTVYLNAEPAGGLMVRLSFLGPGCGLFCDPVLEEITTATTAADGTYRLEAEEPDGGWSCDTTLRVEAVDYPYTSQRVSGCSVHDGIDFRLP